MNDEEQPIFDFAPLKAFLKAQGYTIGEGGAWVALPPVEITPESFRNGTISFLPPNNDIIYTDTEGRKYQVFLYKRSYHLTEFGKPRFHICRCRTINSFIKNGGENYYRAANSEPVTVIDLDEVDINNNEKKISGLPLCSFCARIVMPPKEDTNSTDFAKFLQDVNKEDVDLFGYTRDWESISLAYRKKHNYTCECCGLEITDSYGDRQFVHVHHKDGNKLNNEESNLQCLCLYCHAHVDDRHFKRLTTGANRFTYNDFIKKYKQ